MATVPAPEPYRGFVSTDPELAAADASVRWPVLACLLTAVHWMVLGTFLLVYASSMTHPQDAAPILGYFNNLSANVSMFTYGRVWSTAVDSLVYGWASTAGLGLVIWLLARLGRTPNRAPAALMTGIVFWNLGVAVGLTGIFMGDSTGYELLEFPFYASWILWLSLALIAFWGIVNYLERKPGADHLAQTWLLTGLFFFPWLYAAGSVLLSSTPIPGTNVIQAIINAWYVHGLYTLWLAPVGLGTLYYLIPKTAGVPLRHGSYAQVSFWIWIVVAPWTAVHDLVGGPFPASTVTLGLVLSGLIFLPVALIGVSLVRTSFDGEDRSHTSVVLPFLTLGAVFFVIAGISEEILSVRSASDLLRFTMFRECNMFLWVYGFFSFTIFGAFYYIFPRLLNFGWRSTWLIRAHYYASLYGILLLLVMLGFGGVMQGLTLENPDVQVTISTATQVSLSFYIGTTMCLSLIAIGNGIFALHLGWMFLDWLGGGVRAKGGNYIHPDHFTAASAINPALAEEARR